MAVLTKQFLDDIGVELDNATFESLAEHAETTLHERVIQEISEELTVEQAEQLTKLAGGDDATLQNWLVENVPDLQEIVSDEVDILLGEIAENSASL